MESARQKLIRLTPSLALLSLCINLLLGFQLYRITSAAPNPLQAISLGEVTADQLNPPHPLLGQTLQPTSERAIIAQQLKLRLWSSYPRSSYHYWQSGYNPVPDTWLEHRRQWLLACRAKLLQLFGPTAVYEPLFSEFFFPLRELMPFLSSEAQARIYAEGYRPKETHTNQATVSLTDAFLSAANYPQPERLTKLLNPPELYEFDLRYSTTAQRMRHSGVALDEEQFREIFYRARRYAQQPSANHLQQLYTVLHEQLEQPDAKHLLAALTSDG